MMSTIWRASFSKGLSHRAKSLSSLKAAGFSGKSRSEVDGRLLSGVEGRLSSGVVFGVASEVAGRFVLGSVDGSAMGVASEVAERFVLGSVDGSAMGFASEVAGRFVLGSVDGSTMEVDEIVVATASFSSPSCRAREPVSPVSRSGDSISVTCCGQSSTGSSSVVGTLTSTVEG